MLTGQEYVDEYAAKVKDQLKAEREPFDDVVSART
jgi:hypothetical protein